MSKENQPTPFLNIPIKEYHFEQYEDVNIPVRKCYYEEILNTVPDSIPMGHFLTDTIIEGTNDVIRAVSRGSDCDRSDPKDYYFVETPIVMSLVMEYWDMRIVSGVPLDDLLSTAIDAAYKKTLKKAQNLEYPFNNYPPNLTEEVFDTDEYKEFIRPFSDVEMLHSAREYLTHLYTFEEDEVYDGMEEAAKLFKEKWFKWIHEFLSDAGYFDLHQVVWTNTCMFCLNTYDDFKIYMNRKNWEYQINCPEVSKAKLWQGMIFKAFGSDDDDVKDMEKFESDIARALQIMFDGFLKTAFVGLKTAEYYRNKEKDKKATA